jgi:hypothetical protein
MRLLYLLNLHNNSTYKKLKNNNEIKKTMDLSFFTKMSPKIHEKFKNFSWLFVDIFVYFIKSIFLFIQP